MSGSRPAHRPCSPQAPSHGGRTLWPAERGRRNLTLLEYHRAHTSQVDIQLAFYAILFEGDLFCIHMHTQFNA